MSGGEDEEWRGREGVKHYHRGHDKKHLHSGPRGTVTQDGTFIKVTF